MSVRIGRLNPAAVITTGNPDTVADSAPSATIASSSNLQGQLGSLYRSADGLREWLYVQYSATSTGKAPAANQIAFFISSTSTTATSGPWVVANETSSNPCDVSEVAGIIRTTSTVGTTAAYGLSGKYIWVLRKSPSCLVVSTSTILGVTKGAPVVATTASGEAAVVASTTTAIATTLGASPIYWAGARKIGVINTTTTSYGGSGGIGAGAAVGLGVNFDVALDIN